MAKPDETGIAGRRSKPAGGNVFKAEPSTLRSQLKAGETTIAREAELMIEGVAMNAVVGLTFSRKLGALDLTECFAQLLENAATVTEGSTKTQEAILAAQLVSLNAIYTDLALLARDNLGNLVILERLMRLALKAQSNCRATAEAIACIQNPPTVFAKQANIVNGPQQINNGSSERSFARARRSESQPNKLMESRSEWLDRPTTGAASNCDQELATVGTVDRAQNGQR